MNEKLAGMIGRIVADCLDQASPAEIRALIFAPYGDARLRAAHR